MPPQTPDHFRFDLVPPRETVEPPPRVSGGRQGRGHLGRRLAQLRCLAIGHVWRESRLQGYETCARCHLRRLPLR